MSQKVTLPKNLLANIPSDKILPEESVRNVLNGLVNVEKIWLGVAEKILKGNKIKTLSGRIKYYELLRLEILNEFTDLQFFISPILSGENNNALKAVNGYSVKHLETKIALLKQERQIRSNPIKKNGGLVSNQDLHTSTIDLETKTDEVSGEVHSQSYPQESFMSRKEVAKLFSVTTATITSWMKEGLLPYHKVKRRVYFNKDEIIVVGKSKLKRKI